MRDPAPPRLSTRKKLVFSALTVAGLLLLLELGARVVEGVVPPQEVDYGLGFDPQSRLFVPSALHPGMVVTSPAKRASFPDQEFSARKDAGTLRIAILGGSTVNYLEEELHLLRDHLKAALAPRYKEVEIINGGGLSYGSDRLVHVAMEVLTYEPDLLILYSGHNEFEEVEQLQLAAPDRAALHRLAARSALFRLATALGTGARVARLRREHNQRILGAAPAPARAWRYPFTAADVERRMKAFRDNSALVVSACQKRGVAVILGTLPSNLVRPYLPRQDWERYREVWLLLQAGRLAEGQALGRRILREAVGRHQASDLENDITRALAREAGAPLVDVEAIIAAAEPHGVPGETLFVDHCHLGPAGNRIVREAFEKAILQLLGGASPVR